MDLLRQNFWMLVVVGMIFVSVVIILIFIFINICISSRGIHRLVQIQKRPDSKLKGNTYKERILKCTTPPLPSRTQFLLAEAQSYENLAEAPEDEENVGDYEECVDPPPDSGNTNDRDELYCQPDPNTESGPAAGKSYENLTEDHDYEESIDYVKVEDESETFPAPPSHNPADLKLQSQFSLSQSYKNPTEENDYEESTDQPDYVKVDDESETFPAPPSYNPADLKLQSQSQSYENLTEEPVYEETTDDQVDYIKVDDENLSAHDPTKDSSSEDYDDIGETSDEDDYDDVAPEQF